MRTFPSLLALATLIGGCYSRPSIPRDKPLTCAGTDAADECPSTMACVQKVCALTSCASDLDCPEGLVCSQKTGCSPPGAAGTEDDGGLLARDGGIVIGPGFDGGQPTLPGTGTPGGGLTPPALDAGASPGTPPAGGLGADASSAPPAPGLGDGGLP